MIEANPQHKQWRTKCIQTMRYQYRGTPIDAPVTVTADFAMPPTKTMRNPYPYRSDLDKLCRTIGDALEQAGVLRNDSRIVHWDATKRYAQPGETPGATITITQTN